MRTVALPTRPRGTVTRRLRPTIVRQPGIVLRREKVLDRGPRAVLGALSALRAC